MSVATAYRPTPKAPALSPFPSTRALALEQTPMKGLEQIFQRGATPELDALVGWEFRGINHMPMNALDV
ncbi:MAG: hypothetical protein ABI678_17605, partial [Kofleriaceae bacterium]